MAAPPLSAGAVKLTEACPSPATAATDVGAPAVVTGVTALEGAEASLVPALLVAVTVKV